jgi:hypothetical protein
VYAEKLKILGIALLGGVLSVGLPVTTNKIGHITIIFGLLSGCSAFPLSVTVDTSCSWPVEAPQMPLEVIEDISQSNLTDGSLAALNELDSFTLKHNELYGQYCG